MASQITGVSIVCSTVCSGADQRKHQSFASLACVRGIHQLPVASPHKSPVKRKIFPFDDVIMLTAHYDLSGQGATPVRGGPGWLALNPVGGMREPPSGSMQLQKLQFQSVIYGNPEHSNWHQSFPTHIWLFLAQCGMLAGFIKTMQAEQMQNYKKYINIL